MSEQAVQATVSGPMMGKVFTKTATDDQWDGNTLTDSLSGQQIGILMPGATVNQVQFQRNKLVNQVQSQRNPKLKSLNQRKSLQLLIYFKVA